VEGVSLISGPAEKEFTGGREFQFLMGGKATDYFFFFSVSADFADVVLARDSAAAAFAAAIAVLG
jgi:hypothetical protein